MKQFLSILAGKLTFDIASHFTNCSALPGKVALSLNKDVLKNIKKQNNTIIFITGTNGKTSTTFYSYKTLKNYCNNVITNVSGANMIQGVLTEILKSTHSNTFKDKLCVFEVDELSLPLLIKNGLLPNYIVITNLFDDQIDRYGSKEILANTLKTAIEQTQATVILNYENTTLRIISDNLKNKCIFFGVEGKSDHIISKNNLEYKYINYSDVGLFRNVGDNDFIDLRNFILNPKEDSCEIIENEKVINCNISNKEKFDIIYNKYNFIAAYSLFKTLVNDGIVNYNDNRDILSFMMNLEVGNGRMEKFTFLNEETRLNLVKNPVGLELSLKEYAKEDKVFDLVLALGNTPADGTDLSWINDVDFKNFIENSKVDKVFITGAAVNILEGFLKDYVEKNNLNINFIKKSTLKDVLNKKTLFLAGFSELKEMRDFINLK